MRDQVYQWLMANARGVFFAAIIMVVIVVVSILVFTGLVLIADGSFYFDGKESKVTLHRNIHK